jgi:predicted DNA-binding protein
MPTVTCKLPPELDARLSAISRARQMTKSEVIRTLLEAHLSPRTASRQVRAYDLVRHVVGRLSGPRDLSHRADHLDDFGE